MQDDSKALIPDVGAQSKNGGPAAEPCQKITRNYRRLRSLSTNRMLHQEKEKPVVQKVFDPTAWYVYGVKRNKEIDVCSFFNDSQDIPFEIEAYAAVQQKKVRTYKKGQHSSGSKQLVEKVVIHGKIFIRVDESHRVATLKQCPLLTHCVVDPTLSRTKEGFRDFARVPDAQIRGLQQHLGVFYLGIADVTPERLAGFLFEFLCQIVLGVSHQRGQIRSADLPIETQLDVVTAFLNGVGIVRVHTQMVNTVDEIVVHGVRES